MVESDKTGTGEESQDVFYVDQSLNRMRASRHILARPRLSIPRRACSRSFSAVAINIPASCLDIALEIEIGSRCRCARRCRPQRIAF